MRNGRVLTVPIVNPIQACLGIAGILVGWIIHCGESESMFGQRPAAVLYEPSRCICRLGLGDTCQACRVGKCHIDMGCSSVHRSGRVPNTLVEGSVVRVEIESHFSV